MDIQETISKARDAITVKRVYGAPYERRRGDGDPGCGGCRRRRRRRPARTARAARSEAAAVSVSAAARWARS